MILIFQFDNSFFFLQEEGFVTRRCAYCLQLCGFPAKLCGDCMKRAYCSKDCQRSDWSVKGNGQRHVNWCRRHERGEEDVDWEVVPIPNKLLGIRAKKLIPAGMKIIVEPSSSSPNGHSGNNFPFFHKSSLSNCYILDIFVKAGIKDLEPVGETLEKKFTSYYFFGPNMGRPLKVALRISRVNHACRPNAATNYDETALVAILFALKDIHPGDEITICYYSPFCSLLPNLPVPGMNPGLNIE